MAWALTGCMPPRNASPTLASPGCAAPERYSLGWWTARVAGSLVGFANVLTDGGTHARLQDVVVDPEQQCSGIGRQLVDLAVEQAADAGCEWLHVDLGDDVADFYFRVLELAFERMTIV